MKKWLIAMLIVGCAMPAFAQKETVITQEDEWVMYSKFENQITEMAGDTAVLGGLYAGGLLNGRFIFGVGANGLLLDVETDSSLLKDLEFMDFWYGGLHTGYIFHSNRLFHLSLECLIGGGQVEPETIAGSRDSETLFAFNPTLDFRLNITERFSIGLNAGYLHIEMSDTEELSSSDLSGPTIGFFLHFTEF